VLLYCAICRGVTWLYFIYFQCFINILGGMQPQDCFKLLFRVFGFINLIWQCHFFKYLDVKVTVRADRYTQFAEFLVWGGEILDKWICPIYISDTQSLLNLYLLSVNFHIKHSFFSYMCEWFIICWSRVSILRKWTGYFSVVGLGNF